MTEKFVRVVADVHCDWEGMAPTYRVFVNEELFGERTWTWTEDYLEESIQVLANPGTYPIRYELVSPHLARLDVRRMRVTQGPGQINDGILSIKEDESQ
jgi:hypothetical protein